MSEDVNLSAERGARERFSSGARCEWPNMSSAFALKCGNPAKTYLYAEGGRWGRWLCGVHVRPAERRGWTEAPLSGSQEAE